MTSPHLSARSLGTALLVGLVLARYGLSGSQPATAGSGDERRAAARTTISFTVLDCRGCEVVPIQNKNGGVTYQAPTQVADSDDDVMTFRVPTRRTREMAFLVYAPFDEAAQGGVPAVAVVGFRDKEPGEQVTRRFASRTRTASGGWSGIARSSVSSTLIVRKVRVRDALLGPGRHTGAAAYLSTTMRSRPFHVRVPKNALHASDPSICR